MLFSKRNEIIPFTNKPEQQSRLRDKPKVTHLYLDVRFKSRQLWLRLCFKTLCTLFPKIDEMDLCEIVSKLIGIKDIKVIKELIHQDMSLKYVCS